MADFSHWRDVCFKNKYWRSKTAKVGPKAKLGPISHSSYEGGTLCVPQAELPILYDAIAKDVADNPRAKFYLTEFHTDTFPMYFDIDLKGVPADLRPRIHDALKETLVPEVAKFFVKPVPGCHTFDSVWCVAEAAQPLTGLHIYMPKLIVKVESALAMRYALVMQMYARYPHMLPKPTTENEKCDKWEDIIDAAVYSGGLRMPGALLLKDCSHCKEAAGDKADPQCPYSCNRGKMNVGRRYVFLDYVTTQETEHTQALRYQLKTNWGALLRHTTLRSAAEVTPGFKVYEGCPKTDDKGNRKTSANCLPYNHPVMPDLLELIRSLKPCYELVTIDKVAKLAGGALYRVYVNPGGNSTWCENRRGYHKSSRVQFEVRVSGIRIRCGCKKMDLTNRRFGPCPKYATDYVELSSPVRQKLFPNKGLAVNLRRALKRKNGERRSGTNYLAQSTELSFGRFLHGSQEASRETSRESSRNTSNVTSPALSRRVSS